jgi:protein SCO1/2
VLADYTCETLCGPVVAIVADALSHSGLQEGADFRFIVIGLDPKDTAEDAARMKQAQLGQNSTSHFLTADAGSISALTKALGFVSVYDRDRDQFAHPAAAFVISPGGRISRALPGLAVDPASIRLAIVDAAKGTVGTLTDHIRLLCYGYDPASGTYSVAIGRILAAAGGVTVAALMLLIGLLLRHSRPAPQPAADGLRCASRSRTSTAE